MNRKVIIIAIAAIFVLCLCGVAVVVGVFYWAGSGAPAAPVPTGSPDALLTDPLGGFARAKIDPLASWEGMRMEPGAGYQALYKGKDGQIKVIAIKLANHSKASALVYGVRDTIKALDQTLVFAYKLGAGPRDEVKWDGLKGADRAGIAWDNGEWFFYVAAQTLADRDAILKALPY